MRAKISAGQSFAFSHVGINYSTHAARKGKSPYRPYNCAACKYLALLKKKIALILNVLDKWLCCRGARQAGKRIKALSALIHT